MLAYIEIEFQNNYRRRFNYNLHLHNKSTKTPIHSVIPTRTVYTKSSKYCGDFYHRLTQKRNVRKMSKNGKPFRLFASFSKYILYILLYCMRKQIVSKTNTQQTGVTRKTCYSAQTIIYDLEHARAAGAGAFYTTWRVSSDKFAVCLNNPVSGPISATPVIPRLCLHTYFS